MFSFYMFSDSSKNPKGLSIPERAMGIWLSKPDPVQQYVHEDLASQARSQLLLCVSSKNSRKICFLLHMHFMEGYRSQARSRPKQYAHEDLIFRPDHILSSSCAASRKSLKTFISLIFREKYTTVHFYGQPVTVDKILIFGYSSLRDARFQACENQGNKAQKRSSPTKEVSMRRTTNLKN